MKVAFGLDLSEKGVKFKEAYLQLDDPYLNILTKNWGNLRWFSDRNKFSSKRESRAFLNINYSRRERPWNSIKNYSS